MNSQNELDTCNESFLRITKFILLLNKSNAPQTDYISNLKKEISILEESVKDIRFGTYIYNSKDRTIKSSIQNLGDSSNLSIRIKKTGPYILLEMLIKNKGEVVSMEDFFNIYNSKRKSLENFYDIKKKIKKIDKKIYGMIKSENKGYRLHEL